jgi:hypothetical protein
MMQWEMRRLTVRGRPPTPGDRGATTADWRYFIPHPATMGERPFAQ